MAARWVHRLARLVGDLREQRGGKRVLSDWLSGLPRPESSRPPSFRTSCRDPTVDPFAKELLSYFQRCIDSRQPDINLGFLSI